jgi:CHAT domain-containing protein
MNDDMPRHPEAHTMAAFVDGKLAPGEIAEVAGHLRECSDCRTIVTETARFDREEARIQLPRPAVRTWWLAAAALLAAIAITVPLLRWHGGRATSPMARLIEAAPRQHRFVEARLSGFRWAQLQAPARGRATPDPADLKLAGAAGEVLGSARDRREPAAQHAAGVAYVLIDQRSEGITELEQAARASEDPRVWNDLAAARYAIAVMEEHSSELPLALGDVDHALRLDPRLPEALFNRALILERIGLRDQARKAWLAYLAVDGGSAWSVEAQAHLRAIPATTTRFDPKLLEGASADRLVRAFPQEVRSFSEGPLLAAWADSEAANDPAGASAKLARIRLIANALAAFNGEHLLDDAVTAIERSKGAERAALVQAHRVYRAARMDYSKRKAGAAETQFHQAAELFRRGASPMADVADYYAASAAFDQNRSLEARDELVRLLGRIDLARHRALAMQIHQELAVDANAAGDWGTAAREGGTAATTFRLLGERANAAVSDGVAAVALEAIGDGDRAWSHRRQALEDLDAGRLNGFLHSAALTLSLAGHPAAAGAIMDLRIDRERGGDPAALAEALVDRSRLAGGADDARAESDLAEARLAATRVSDRAIRETLEAEIDVAGAALPRAARGGSPLPSLDRAIAFLGSRGLGRLLPEAYLQRARAHRSAGAADAAASDYASAMREMERQRESVSDAALRLSFLGTASQIVDESIALELSRGRVAEAFAIANRSHGTGAAAAMPLRSEPRVAAIEYAVLPHSVAIFLLTPEGISEHTVPIERQVLVERIRDLAAGIQRRAALAEINAGAGNLFKLLIAPLQPGLARFEELTIVPDGELTSLPFAALYDESRRQYLVEQFSSRVTPSVSGALDTAPSTLEPALVVSDPQTPGQAPLTGGREEAARVAAMHRATLLEGVAATPARFIEAAKGSALIHYTGHADSEAGDAYGALLLSGDAGRSGALASSDIARLPLSRHPIVVMAACGTLRPSAVREGGSLTVARSFLVAGAQAVAGTLWEIDDDVSTPLILRFHERLRTGAPPAAALRDAQVAMLHAEDPRLAHPATWAPLALISNK